MARRRLQFSLRTLLIVTALVAVGVKLWIGLHRVKMRYLQALDHFPILTEDCCLAATFSFSYNRNWDGSWVVIGPISIHSPRVDHVLAEYSGENKKPTSSANLTIEQESDAFCRWGNSTSKVKEETARRTLKNDYYLSPSENRFYFEDALGNVFALEVTKTKEGFVNTYSLKVMPVQRTKLNELYKQHWKIRSRTIGNP